MSHSSTAARKPNKHKQVRRSGGATRNPDQPKRGAMPDEPNMGGPHGRKLGTSDGVMPDEPNMGGPHGDKIGDSQ